MKIAHFGKYYFPDVGGIESVTLSIAKGAVMAGHSVSVVCFGKTNAKKKEVIDGVLVTRVPIMKLLASQPLSFSYFLECLSAAYSAEIVHLHAPNMLAALSSLFLPKKTRMLVHWHSDVINKGLLGKILRPLESAMLRRANRIIATSQVYADASETLAQFKSKIVFIPIGVPDIKHEGNGTRLPPSFEKLIGNRKIILAVGRLIPYKGFELLISAAQQLDKKSLVVIVGGGPLQGELETAIQFCEVNDSVVMTGRLCDLDLHALFERAALYCLPSTHRAEAFGVVLLEAMAYGLPIVASDIPGSGVPWVNQHGISGLNVPVGDPKALAQACNLILDSAELHMKFARGARQRFLSEFTEEISVGRMMVTYNSLFTAS